MALLTSRLGPSRIAPLWLTLVATFFVCALSSAATALPGEYDIKAAFLLNFTRFVDWAPAHPTSRPLVIGILGKDPFGPAIDAIIAGEAVGERPIQVRRLARLEEVTEVDTLFVSPSEKARLDEILELVRSRPILTVSDLPDFAEAGGIIGLVTENKRIRLHINADVAHLSGVSLSSKLLRPALIVRSRRRSSSDTLPHPPGPQSYARQMSLYHAFGYN